MIVDLDPRLLITRGGGAHIAGWIFVCIKAGMLVYMWGVGWNWFLAPTGRLGAALFRSG